MRLGIVLAQLMLAGLSNKKGALRKRLPVLDGYTEPSWSAPDPDDCDPEEAVTIDLDATSRIIQRTLNFEGRLVDYALVLQGKGPSGRWEEAAKIDCCHAQVHLHQRYASSDTDDSRVVLREVSGETDIQESINDAIDLIYSDYDELLRRWRNGH